MYSALSYMVMRILGPYDLHSISLRPEMFTEEMGQIV